MSEEKMSAIQNLVNKLPFPKNKLCFSLKERIDSSVTRVLSDKLRDLSNFYMVPLETEIRNGDSGHISHINVYEDVLDAHQMQDIMIDVVRDYCEFFVEEHSELDGSFKITLDDIQQETKDE